MTAVVILNVVLVAFVVFSIVGLLGWAIVTDKTWAASLPRRRHARVAAPRRAHARGRAGAVLDPS